jgi:hypothetical protein
VRRSFVLDLACPVSRDSLMLVGSHGGAHVEAGHSFADAACSGQAGLDKVDVVQGDLLRPPLRTAAAGGRFDWFSERELEDVQSCTGTATVGEAADGCRWL